ncbi:MAG: hypothetical protein O2890_12260 [Cyanobacteria bacterium]|nr:hypothetical protein [Cyanobacteriota bacterium]
MYRILCNAIYALDAIGHWISDGPLSAALADAAMRLQEQRNLSR